MQDMKPDHVESCGGKTASAFLQNWLRQQSVSGSCAGAGSSKRRKGRPRKYVAAAGDRTLTGDALLVDTASDSGVQVMSTVIPQTHVPRPTTCRSVTPITADDPALAASQKPTISARKPRALKRNKLKTESKLARRKDKAFQRGRRQPIKYIPTADRHPPVKPHQSAASTSSQATGSTVDGPVKRSRGRPRTHPAISVVANTRSVPPARKTGSNTAVARRQFTDVEGDSSDSDVIVTAYIAPRNAVNQTCEKPASTDGKKRHSTTGVASGVQKQRKVSSKVAANTEVTQPVKRKRGRPRKHPLPTSDPVAVNNSAGRRGSTIVVQRRAAAESRAVRDERRRVTRALTAAQMQHEWNTSRLTSECSITPARNVPPLYYELSSSSDSEEPAPDVRSDGDRHQNDIRQKRKRRRSIPSRSLELSFSSIEKDDFNGGEAASGRSPSGRLSHHAVEMTSTPLYDRAMSARDSTLRSRWINVEHRVTEMTTTATVHRDANERFTSASQSNVRPTASAARQCSASGAVLHRRRRRRPSDNADPDWRRYPTKQSRKPSHGERGLPIMSTAYTSPSTTLHNDPPAYDEAELDTLVELQRRLASTTNGHVLREVVEIIEASGRYHVEDATFDFDLCSLDHATVTKLRRCLGV